MITADIQSYLSANFADCYQKISDISRSGDDKPLVQSGSRSGELYAYNFDEITRRVFDSRDMPTSADAISFIDDGRRAEIILTEFKRGMLRRSRKSDGKARFVCEHTGRYCPKIRDALDFKTEAIEKSIALKAIESFDTLSRYIIPNCCESGKKFRITLCIVNDDSAKAFESLLSDRAGKQAPNGDPIINKLSRFKRKDNPSRHYIYDNILLLTPRILYTILE